MRSTRSGSTLTEVLVALMIMSIGLVSLATLFPLATLRAVKASQLTHATDLRYNAEALLEMYPQLLFDPDLNPQTSNLPFENGRIPANVGLAIGSNSPVPQFRKWVIDPIGWVSANEPLTQQFCDSFGRHPYTLDPWTNVQRFAFGRTVEQLADAFAAQPDSFVTLFEGRISSLNVVPNSATGATQAVVPGTNSLNVPVGSRLVFFSINGRTIQTRILVSFDSATQTLTWTEDLDGNGNQQYHALPPNFQTERVRIEIAERRYTWLLTVRRANADFAEVDVVVFYNRGLSFVPRQPNNDEAFGDEALYEVHDRTNDPVLGFVAGSSTISVTYRDRPRPTIRKGGWLFDAGNARWYQILDFQENPAMPGVVLVKIDPPIVASSPRDDQDKLQGNYAMFPRGVVDVFPLGAKP